jgi:hypothetical protein
MMPMHPALKKSVIPVGGGYSLERRIFADSIIQKHVDDALSGVEGSGAVLDVRLDDERVAAVMAARLGEHWSLGLVVERQHTGELSGGARVVFDW